MTDVYVGPKVVIATLAALALGIWLAVPFPPSVQKPAPDIIVLYFDPQPDITPYELATIVQRTVFRGPCVRFLRDEHDRQPATITRHFRRPEGECM
jgi:hypothetical protein